jgi:hypothetical protein
MFHPLIVGSLILTLTIGGGMAKELEKLFQSPNSRVSYSDKKIKGENYEYCLKQFQSPNSRVSYSDPTGRAYLCGIDDNGFQSPNSRVARSSLLVARGS